MKTLNNERCFFVVQFEEFDLVRCARVGKKDVELFIQRINRIEGLREHEVEQQPELRKVVLYGSTVVSCRERLCRVGPSVLHAVALIYNKVRFTHYSKAEVLVNPFHLAQDRSVFDSGAHESNPSLLVTEVG